MGLYLVPDVPTLISGYFDPNKEKEKWYAMGMPFVSADADGVECFELIYKDVLNGEFRSKPQKSYN